MGASLANTSLTIAEGACSSSRPPLATMSRALGWSHRTTPVVLVPEPSRETARPAVLAKFPPVVMGKTMGCLGITLRITPAWLRRKRASMKKTPSNLSAGRSLSQSLLGARKQVSSDRSDSPRVHWPFAGPRSKSCQTAKSRPAHTGRLPRPSGRRRRRIGPDRGVRRDRWR